MLHKETIAFEWEIIEYDFKQKRKDWYWIVGFTAIILIAVGIFLENYLFSFFVLLGGFLMINMASKEPLSIPVQISQHGVKLGNMFLDYETISAFWISENAEGEKMLLLLTENRISPVMSLIIDQNIEPLEMREYLLNFIEETEIRESLTNRIIKKIGF